MSNHSIIAPSLGRSVSVAIASQAPEGTSVGTLVTPTDIPADLDPAMLAAHGFKARAGSAIQLWAGNGGARVLGGLGDAPSSADVRDAAAAVARSTGNEAALAIVLPAVPGLDAAQVAEVVVEGALLARYSYDSLRKEPQRTPITDLTLVVERAVDHEAASSGAEKGRILAGATALARDLANSPYNHLTAVGFAEFAEAFGPTAGLAVEVFGMDEIRTLRLGGLLGVNAGSVDPARMIKLTYTPAGDPSERVALVGKGIMYDAGGLSLKPSDGTHAQMKNDMTGAATILAAMATLRELGSTREVTGYLMCTSNMPSGSATALGDVLTMRDGTTVEIIDTDAEGRLVMGDGLALAAEAGPDVIFDIATLTGSASRALGPEIAAVLGNDQTAIDRARVAGEAAGEPLWQLPLHRPYLRMLDSDTADMANCGPIGLPDAILASLFLDHFTKGTPWAHIDIAGTGQSPDSRSVRVPGCSGFGARLLAHLLS